VNHFQNSDQSIPKALFTSAFSAVWRRFDSDYFPEAADAECRKRDNVDWRRFFWWEIDITYHLLKALSRTGFIWDLRTAPESAYFTANSSAAFDAVLPRAFDNNAIASEEMPHSADFALDSRAAVTPHS
jgi:hypothetical protein